MSEPKLPVRLRRRARPVEPTHSRVHTSRSAAVTVAHEKKEKVKKEKIDKEKKERTRR